MPSVRRRRRPQVDVIHSSKGRQAWHVLPLALLGAGIISAATATSNLKATSSSTSWTCFIGSLLPTDRPLSSLSSAACRSAYSFTSPIEGGRRPSPLPISSSSAAAAASWSFLSTSSSSSPFSKRRERRTRIWAKMELPEPSSRRPSSSSSSSMKDKFIAATDRKRGGGKRRSGKEGRNGDDDSTSLPSSNRLKKFEGLTREDAVKALGLTLLAGVILKASTIPGPSEGDLAASSALPSMNKKKGYLGWRRLSDVENRSWKGQDTYPVRFVTYLSRFLVNFDPDDKMLWRDLAKEIPFTYNEKQVQDSRQKQFASIADSVQIGLYDYQGERGIEKLFDLLSVRYAQSAEARRQLAILFTFLGEQQPVLKIVKLLSDTDNASVTAFRLLTGGNGYTGDKPPQVTISSPMMDTYEPALARAVLRDLGSIRRIKIQDKGCLYTHGIPPEVVISNPPMGPESRRAKAEAILDGKGGIKEVILKERGAGYRSDRPISITFLPRGEGEAEEKLRLEAGGGEGGCRGGAKAVAVLDKEVSRIDLLDGGAGYVVPIGAEVEIDPPAEPDGQRAKALAVVKPAVVVNTNSIGKRYSPLSFTAQLQQLLPSDTGGPAEDYLTNLRPASTMFDPIFGPVGKSPIEMEKELDLESYIRLALSGGCCISIVRASLTPLEILKTRMQARPNLYPGLISGFKRIKEEGGSNPFYKAWECTTLAGFSLGMLGFGFNEFFRRVLTDWVGPGSSMVFEVPIILVASAMATLLTSLLTCPLEAVRIRTMSTSDELPFGGFVRVGIQMFQTTGIGGLYDGLEPLLFREVPFIMTKFLVFDFIRNLLFGVFPAAQESVNNSLIISLVAGLAAGVAGAFTGCPADAVLVRVNSNPEEVDWRAMVKVMLNEPGGWKNLFAGVNVRIFFFALLIGIQFFLYDWFKVLFGVAADDLTLVLDVFSSPGEGSSFMQ